MKSAIRLTAILFLILVSGGCSATRYGPGNESWTGGYSESKLQNDMYNVSFVGNAWISHERAMNYLLYRCSEITIANGFDYFIITKGESATGYAVLYGGSTVSKPNLTVTIKLGNGSKPADNANAYDARELMKNLESKIQR